jgi:hypothetical protein
MQVGRKALALFQFGDLGGMPRVPQLPNACS